MKYIRRSHSVPYVRFLELFFVIALSSSCSNNSQSVSAQNAGRGSQSAQSASTGEQKIEVTKVSSQKLFLTVHLPGDIYPYESVVVYPKITAFVRWIGVDRGSHVKAGQEIIRLEAPELVSQKQEAESKLQAAQAQASEAEAKLASDQSTFERLSSAAATPGVVAGNDLEVARQTMEADRARVRATEQNIAAAKSALKAVSDIEAYLRVAAPFDGIVTERDVHPGALVGPNGNQPMVRIEKISRLRLVVPIPENYVAGTVQGANITFSVPAFPGEKFTGTVARIPDSLDVKTRTMPVELDVRNPTGRLAPGMYPEVEWPVRRQHPTLFVPAASIARTNEKTFVVRIRDGKAEWVDVHTGLASTNSVEVFGDLHEGDLVASRGTDELKPGTTVRTQQNSSAAQ